MKKRQLEKGERAFVAALGVFSVICLAASIQMFLKAPKLNGEGTMPLITSLVLVAMTVIMFLEMRGCPSGFAGGTALAQKCKEAMQFLFPGMVGVIVIYCLLYAVLLGFVGFSIATFAFLAGSMLTLNRKKKVQPFVVSAIALACVLFLFQVIFKVQLP